MCHDVLVSSFLCPIGSTFSQKLLTCDWWTKVDCTSTGRYLEVNRNSYQIDDDEMIRKAYAMISLQSSAEDVTRDGLVDPDSGARIVDYSALGAGRIVTGYTPGFRRITDYTAVDTAAGNDLPDGFEVDYPHRDNRRIVASYERYDQQQRANTNVYRGKFQMEDKGRSPYHASPIIRHDYQHRSGDNEFRDDYRRPIGGFTDQLQASYAPTVPTVTTTTRRLYSPTVPTTYRPSTLAYSKLDLMMDSSDHLYAHSKSSVTPAAIARHDDDAGNIDLRKSESGHGAEPDPTESDGVSVTTREPEGGARDDAARRSKETHKVRLGFENRSETSFRINVTDTIDEDEVFRQQSDRPVTVDDNQDSLEDIETKDSIGIARALNDPPRTVVRDQSRPMDQLLKSERTNGPTTPIPVSRTEQDRLPGNVNVTNPSERRSDRFNETNGDRPPRADYVIAVSTTKSPAETYTRSFGDRTTPLLRTWQPRNDDVVQPSFISLQTARSATSTTERSVDQSLHGGDERFPLNDNRTSVNRNSSVESIGSNDESTPRVDLNHFGIPPPAQFLRPPMESFFINVPEGGSRYTTIDESLEGASWNPETTTTQVPRFSNNDQDEPSSYNENIEESSSLTDYDESVPETSSLGTRPTVQPIIETTTSTPWLVSTYSPDQPVANVPVTDIVPPIVDYNDGFGDFVPPREHSRDTEEKFDHADSQSTRNSPPARSRQDNETEVLSRYNTGFAFTIRDAIKAQPQPRVDHSTSPCDEHILRFCGTSSVASSGIAVSTPGAHERTISIGTKANGRIPERFFYSSSTKSPDESMTAVSSEFSASTTQSSINTEDSVLKTEVTPRMKNPEGRIERTEAVTESSVPRSVRPGTRLKQIEEAIDEHDSPYEVSFTVKKNEDLQPIADDFISRLIARHQRPVSILNEQLDGLEIVKSVERSDDDKVAGISQLPVLSEASRAPPDEDNGSFFVGVNDTIDRSRQGESNVSMLNLLHLMAELLKLDRLPRPFSAKDLRSVELRDSFNLNLDESPSVATSPSLELSDANANSKVSTFDSFLRPPAEPGTSLNSDLDKPSFVTVNPPFDHSHERTPFGSNSKAPALDFTKTPTNIARPKTSLDLDRLNKPSSVTAGSLLAGSQTGMPFGEIANPKTPTVDTANIAQSKALLNLNIDRPPAVTATPLSDYTQSRGPFANADPERFSFDVTSKVPINKHVALKPSAGVPFAINNATERKTSQLESANKTVRPLRKERILEQLAANFGRPLYRGGKSLIFDLPQVQRSLDFESGLPIAESERAVDESDAENPAETATTTTQRTTTTTESVKTIVETEFVPSLGFSFDTNEDREQYVQAILGGLIDEEAGRNESSVAQLTDEVASNATLRLEQRETDGSRER